MGDNTSSAGVRVKVNICPLIRAKKAIVRKPKAPFSGKRRHPAQYCSLRRGFQAEGRLTVAPASWTAAVLSFYYPQLGRLASGRPERAWEASPGQAKRRPGLDGESICALKVARVILRWHSLRHHDLLREKSVALGIGVSPLCWKPWARRPCSVVGLTLVPQRSGCLRHQPAGTSRSRS